MTEGNGHSTGALHNVKVLDLTQFGAGPVCTMILADMGAETIKLERPGKGDPGRWNNPNVEDMGGYFPAFNRNKKSITLDLSQPRGKELFRRLVLWADLVAENFRPGALARLGFPYETLREIKPEIILVSVSGFGQTGPYAHRASFDPVAQAMGGMMAATGRAVGHPIPAGAIVGDLTGGLFCTVGALLALHHKSATGKGQWVDASLLEGQLYFLGSQFLANARQPREQRAARASSPLGGSLFKMKDGSYEIIMFQDDNHWPRLAKVIGRPDVIDDPRFNSRAKRHQPEAVEAVHNIIQEWASTVTAAEAEPILDANGLAFGRVMDAEGLLEDPHVKVREAIQFVQHATGEVLPLVGVFPKLSDTPGSIRTSCPHLGQHNEEVYCGVLGLSKEEFTQLVAQKVI